MVAILGFRVVIRLSAEWDKEEEEEEGDRGSSDMHGASGVWKPVPHGICYYGRPCSQHCSRDGGTYNHPLHVHVLNSTLHTIRNNGCM